MIGRAAGYAERELAERLRAALALVDTNTTGEVE